MKKEERFIKITKDGPYEIYGNLPLNKESILTDNEGFPIKYKKIKDYPKEEIYYLCRCGSSNTKPFCNGNHKKIGFVGKETASKEKYIIESEKIDGKDIFLTDCVSLCSGAGFCNAREGNIWDLIVDSKKSSKDLAIKQALNCPSGRLTIWDKKTKKPYEPKFKPSITILYEPWKKVGGPIFVKGRIKIKSEDNSIYEIRNRVTLCRCGKSNNKPFCDSTHRYIGFIDDEE